MNKKEEIPQPNYMPLVTAITMVILTVVAILYLGPKFKTEVDLSFLPKLNAGLNLATAVMLMLGLVSIKQKVLFMHKRFMTAAIVFSACFLVSYILYHSTHESTTYGGVGAIRYFYYFILISHIILAAIITPLVLITYVRALAKRFDKHRKIARITLPLWLYVSITGVIVYIMISPYYS